MTRGDLQVIILIMKPSNIIVSELFKLSAQFAAEYLISHKYQINVLALGIIVIKPRCWQ